MQIGFPCEAAEQVDCLLRGNQAAFQESFLVAFLLAHPWRSICISINLHISYMNLSIQTHLTASAKPFSSHPCHISHTSHQNVSQFGCFPCRFFEVQYVFLSTQRAVLSENPPVRYVFQLVSCFDGDVVNIYPSSKFNCSGLKRKRKREAHKHCICE